jgi:hypothetical protein
MGSLGRTVESNRLGGACAAALDPAAVPCPADNGWPRGWGRELSTQALGTYGVTEIKAARLVVASSGADGTRASQTRYVGGTAQVTKWLERCRSLEPGVVIRVDKRGHLADYFQFAGAGWTNTSIAHAVDAATGRG